MVHRAFDHALICDQLVLGIRIMPYWCGKQNPGVPEHGGKQSLKLSEYRKVNPGPVEEFLFYDHPSPRHRIFSAMRWKAEQVK